MVNVMKFPPRTEFFFPIEQAFNRILDNFWSAKTFNFLKGTTGYPKMDIRENKEKLSIVAAVPGVDPENLKVEILPGNLLKISGEMSQQYQSPKDATYFVKELHKSKFVREVQLPDDLNGEPEAELKNGVLTLSWMYAVTKAEEKTKLITIKSSTDECCSE
jgi:HSP20 family protein